MFCAPTVRSLELPVFGSDELFNSNVQFAQLFVSFRHELSLSLSLISACEKKWKEINKVLLMKLSLLTSLIQGYEMDMSTLEFLYVSCLCGNAWHPAAAAHFSQHYNEQGIAKLKSEINSHSKYILKVLQLQLLPLAQNLNFKARDLLAMLTQIKKFKKSNDDLGINSFEIVLLAINKSSEDLMFKLDDTLREARIARERLLLYVQVRVKSPSY
jgi:hypothetical protein